MPSISLSDNASRSFPLYMISPPAILPGGDSISLGIDKQVTLLPIFDFQNQIFTFRFMFHIPST
jgi:hypothetical protein